MNRDEIQIVEAGFQAEAQRAGDSVSAVNEKVEGTRGRRWLLVLGLAGIAGFVGSGGALTPGRIAPLVSWIVPDMVANVDWASAAPPRTAHARKTNSAADDKRRHKY